MTGKIDTVMIFSKSDRSGSTQNIYKKKFCNQISGISAKNAIFYGTEYEVLADFGSVGKIEINLLAAYEQLLRAVFFVFMEKKLKFY